MEFFVCVPSWEIWREDAVVVGSEVCSYQNQRLCNSLGLFLILPPDGHPDGCWLPGVTITLFHNRARGQARKLLFLGLCLFLGKRRFLHRFLPTSGFPRTCTWPALGAEKLGSQVLHFPSSVVKEAKQEGVEIGSESTCKSATGFESWSVVAWSLPVSDTERKAVGRHYYCP